MGTEANLIAGPLTVYTAPLGEALPEKDDLAPSTITVTPGGNWTAEGFTVEEFSLTYTPTYTGVQPNEASADVEDFLVREEAMFEYVQAEDDMTAWNNNINASSLTTTAAAGDQTGQDILGVGNGTSTMVSLLIKGENPEGGTRLIHVYKAKQTEATNWTRSREHHGTPNAFKFYEDTTKTKGKRLFKVYDITTSATS